MTRFSAKVMDFELRGFVAEPMYKRAKKKARKEFNDNLSAYLRSLLMNDLNTDIYGYQKKNI